MEVAFGIAIAITVVHELGREYMLAYSISLAHESREVCDEAITGIHGAFYRRAAGSQMGQSNAAQSKNILLVLTPTQYSYLM